VAGRALWFYAGKLFWPANLTFSYPRWDISANRLPGCIGLGALAVLGAFIWRLRGRWGRGLETGVLFYIVTLAPVSGLVMLYTFHYSFVADHYQYLACLGVIALFAGAAVRVCARLGLNRYWKTALAAALVLTLAVLTWRQCRMYANLETLWRETIRRNPASWLAHNNLGILYFQRGQFDEAFRCFQDAAKAGPDYAEAHNNLGFMLLQSRQLEAADAEFQQAVRVDPDYADAHNNLGLIRVQRGEPSAAVEQFRLALKANPAHGDALANLAWILATANDAALRNGAQALEYAHHANTLFGGSPDSLRVLAAASAEAGRFDDATAFAQQALALAQGRPRESALVPRLREDLQSYAAGQPLRGVAR
jgi:Tfp pilus assembly protein PilF